MTETLVEAKSISKNMRMSMSTNRSKNWSGSSLAILGLAAQEDQRCLISYLLYRNQVLDRSYIKERNRSAGKSAVAKFRREDIGLVFQHYANSNLTVEENIQLGSKYAAEAADLEELASLLGIEKLLNKSSSAVGPGERQRVLARAVIKKPTIFVCDDRRSGQRKVRTLLFLLCYQAKLWN